jgi:exopolysaccharide biosynthesis polyprenyl glycosylphosphotransferase
MVAARFSLRILWLILADAVMLFAGVILAMYLRLGVAGTAEYLDTRNGWLKIALASGVCLLILYFYDLYDYVVMTNRRELLLRMVQALGIAWALLAVGFYFAPGLLIGRGVSVISVPIVLALLLGWRIFIHTLTGHPEIGEKILVVGTGQTALDTAEAVWERRDAGYRIVGFVSENGAKPGDRLGRSAILGKAHELENVIRAEKVDRVVIAVRERRGAFPTEALLKMSLAGDISIEECTSFFERITGKVHVDMLRPSWLIFAGRKRDTPVKLMIREAIHRGLAAAGFVLSLPLALVTAVLIKIDSRGPILYRQERVGTNGKTFELLKFRSMKVDAEADGTPVWALTNDDRVTRVGRVIRKLRIDEIPQFWNIIKGEMNFVGPRPERPHFVEQLATEIP